MNFSKGIYFCNFFKKKYVIMHCSKNICPPVNRLLFLSFIRRVIHNISDCIENLENTLSISMKWRKSVCPCCGLMVGYDKHSRQPECEYCAVKIEEFNFFLYP